MSIYFQKKLIEEIERIVDEEIKISHSAISKQIEDLIETKKTMTELGTVGEMDTSLIDLCYVPIVQSGGKYNLKP